MQNNHTNRNISLHENPHANTLFVYMNCSSTHFQFSTFNFQLFETLHIYDDTQKVVQWDTPTTLPSGSTEAATIRYQYSNNLGSACLELDENADIISYEEYHPFGSSAYQAINASINSAAKRYRYCGKEKDDESGFYYYGARYYIPWLCRFTSVDPKALTYVFQSSYVYAENNAVKYVDINGENAGKAGEETKKEKPKGKYFGNLLIRDQKQESDATRVAKPIIKPIITKSTKPKPKPKSDTSPKPIGTLSEKYETGGKGSGTVSSGRGDRGGASYGKYQFASKLHVPEDFLKGEGKQWANEFNGLEAGSTGFTKKWKEIAKRDGVAFGSAQHAFIERTHYMKQVNLISKNTGLDITKRSEALQNVIWSTAVQHGASTKIVLNILKGQDISSMSDKHLIESIYEERGRTNMLGTLVHFSSSSQEVQAGLKNRYAHELKDALKMLSQNK